MAYMSQEKKKEIAAVVKAICKRHGVKASLSVRHHSTLVVFISEGRIDFFADRVDSRWHGDFADPKVAEERLAKDRERGYFDVNPYSWREHFKGAALAFLEELFPALNDGNWDKSDPMTDYFNVGWYVDVDVGRWNKPYKLNPAIPALPALALAREHDARAGIRPVEVPALARCGRAAVDMSAVVERREACPVPASRAIVVVPAMWVQRPSKA